MGASTGDVGASRTADVIDHIMTTRAMRRFTDEPVDDAVVLECLRAAQQGPSGGNVQPQQYVVVTDPDVRSRIAHWYRRAFLRYEATLDTPTEFRSEEDRTSWERTRAASHHLAEHLAEVPVLVLFLQPVIPWGSADDDGPLDIGRLDASVYPAVQNFCLAARAHGLGTALTTVIRVHSEEVFAELGIPEGRYEIAALVPVGHPTGRFGVARRKPVEAVTHWNRFGDRRR
ncbi:MAG: nitroreductase family protein [Ilumatobacter sp.]